jgi:hypothetical protein
MSLSIPADRVVSGTSQQILVLPMMCSIPPLWKSMKRSPARASAARLPRVLKSRLPLKSGKQSSFRETTRTKPGSPPRWETSRPCEESSWSSCADRDAIKNVSASATKLTSLSLRWEAVRACADAHYRRAGRLRRFAGLSRPERHQSGHRDGQVAAQIAATPLSRTRQTSVRIPASLGETPEGDASFAGHK